MQSTMHIATPGGPYLQVECGQGREWGVVDLQGVGEDAGSSGGRVQYARTIRWDHGVFAGGVWGMCTL